MLQRTALFDHSIIKRRRIVLLLGRGGNLVDTQAVLWFVGHDLVTTFLGKRMGQGAPDRVFLPARRGHHVVDGGALWAREQVE
jgi:hypothetical protein